MPIPADISELRIAYKRAFRSVARQYRERAGVIEPLGQASGTEPEAEDCG